MDFGFKNGASNLIFFENYAKKIVFFCLEAFLGKIRFGIDFCSIFATEKPSQNNEFSILKAS